VAANWQWHGREDLPPDWADELSAPTGARDAAYWRGVRAVLDERVAAGGDDVYEWLHRRALVHSELGDAEAARDDHRAAMNADPHLRRATDAMAERARRVAETEGALLVDTIDRLAAASETGLVGFEQFYDYVHFTPRGAVLAAAAAARAVEGVDPAVVTAYVAAHGADPAAEPPGEHPDELDVLAWRGIGFDRARIHSRDLWKFDQALDEIDARLAKDGDDWVALVYRANAAFFRQDGAAEAERDWRRALELAGRPLPEVERNLELLTAQQRPAAD
jgi:tetratricopeptide (TPR) repeat protein